MKKKQPKLTKRRILFYAMQGMVLGFCSMAVVLLWTTEPETLQHLRDFNWPIGIILLGMIITAWLCNGCRIYILSRSLGYPLRFIQSLSVSLSTEFGIASTPAGIGGPAIRLSLLKRAGIPLGHGSSMLAADIALDTLFFILLVPFAFLSVGRNPKIHALFGSFNTLRFLVISLIFLSLCLGFYLVVRYHGLRLFNRWIAKQPWAQKHRLTARFRKLHWQFRSGVVLFSSGFKELFQLKWGSILLVFGLACVQWTCRYGTLPVILYALSIQNDPVLLFMLQGFVFTASLVFVFPGGGGGVEIVMALALKQVILGSMVGVVLLIWRFFTFHLYLLAGGGMFLWTCSKLKTLFPTSILTDEEEISFDSN